MDLNGDGGLDLLVNSYDGGPYLLEGLGKGRFAPPAPVLDREGKRVLIGYYWDYGARKWTRLNTSAFPGEHGISVSAVDWEGDGDLDLVLGTSSGRLFLRKNEGDAEKAAFATECESIRSQGKDLAVPGGGAMVTVADWNGDGSWDIVAGSRTGAVYWFRNVGRGTPPAFEAPRKLVNEAPGAGGSDEALRPGTRVQVSVEDFDGDGLPDLLLGDYSSSAVKGTQFTPERRARYDAVLEEYRSVSDKLSSLIKKSGKETKAGEAGAKEEAGADPERAKLEKRRKELVQELSALRPKRSWHGWVWFFKRRAAGGGR